MALVKLVEHHHADALQLRVAQQAACQDSFGEEAQPRLRPGELLEAHLVADRLAEALAAFESHPAGGQPRGDAARLQHEHFTEARIEQSRGNARRLARARRRFNHQIGAAAERSDDFGKQRIDGKGQHSKAPSRFSSESAIIDSHRSRGSCGPGGGAGFSLRGA